MRFKEKFNYQIGDVDKYRNSYYKNNKFKERNFSLRYFHHSKNSLSTNSLKSGCSLSNFRSCDASPKSSMTSASKSAVKTVRSQALSKLDRSNFSPVTSSMPSIVKSIASSGLSLI